jgi:acyl-CoA hydrolase
MMSKTYTAMVCRGSIWLGSGCGHCERCADEEKEFRMNKTQAEQAAIQSDDVFKAAETTGLPVAGYKKTQPQAFIDIVNENKILEERVLRQIEKMQRLDCGPNGANPFDGRGMAEARTCIQTGFMWLNRAVFQPGRVALPEDAE